jgi:hypothetical protein
MTCLYLSADSSRVNEALEAFDQASGTKGEELALVVVPKKDFSAGRYLLSIRPKNFSFEL